MTKTTSEDRLNKLIKLQEKQISLTRNLFRGIFYGFGFFIGSAVLVGLLIYILSLINTVPIIGQYTAAIVDFVQSHQ